MNDGNEFANPNDICRLNTLKIQTVSGNLSPRIFANGKNQLPIEISVKALDRNGQVLKFSKDMWISILNIRYAESDQKLNLKGSSGWCFTDVKNDYAKEILEQAYHYKPENLTRDDSAIIIMYVYTDDPDTQRIAVSLDTEDGKHFTTADNASGSEKMSVTVQAIPSVNYADKRNVTVIDGGFVTLNNNLGWTSRLTTLGPYKDHYNGTCMRRIVYLQPNSSTTGQTKFKKHEIIYDPIKNNDVNDGTISWYGSLEDCFALMQTGAGYPCAVIGRGYQRNDFQLNLWYSRQNNIHLDGQMYVIDNSYYYRFCPNIEENHYGSNEDGFVTLLLYKFTMPENNTRQYHWHNVIRVVTVKVTDNYGNGGVFELKFDDKEDFDSIGFV